MKRKIICLLVAVLLLTASLVACTQPEEEVPAVVCEAHVDVDANLACDNCGIPVHTIVNKVPTEEEEIAAVVTPIPQGTNLSTLYNCIPDTIDDVTLPAKGDLDKLDTTWENVNGEYRTGDLWIITGITYVMVEEDYVPESYYVVAYNAATGKVLVDESYDYEDPEVKYEVTACADLDGAAIAYLVKKTEYDEEQGYWMGVNYTYYTLSGKKIVEKTHEDVNSYTATSDDSFGYLTVDDVVYIIDNETAKVAYEIDANLFVNRPTYTSIVEINDKEYGYVIYNGNVMIYDLDNEEAWIDCVYTYEIPVDGEAFILANGDILVQTIRELPVSAVNYDYDEDGEKYDIEYRLFKFADKSEATVEFGYLIDGVYTDAEGLNPNIKNVVVATVIENKRLSKSVMLCTDDNLGILCEVEASYPNAQVEYVELIAENLFAANVVYGEGSSVTKIFDKEGKEVATVPTNAVFYGNYIRVGNNIHAMDMSLLIDADKDSYTIEYATETYLILTDEIGNIIHYNPTTEKETKLTKQSDEDNTSAYVNAVGDDYFILTVTTVDEEDVTVEYKLYNEEGAVALTTENMISDIVEIDGKFTIVLANGTVYFG